MLRRQPAVVALRVQFHGAAEMAGGGGQVAERQHGHSGAPVESGDFRRVFHVHFAGPGFDGLLRVGAAAQQPESPRLIAANGGHALAGAFAFHQRMAVEFERALRVRQRLGRVRAFQQAYFGQAAGRRRAGG